MAGNPRIPDSVKFIIASFPQIFGTREAQVLRTWCMAREISLVWSLGPNLPIFRNGTQPPPPSSWNASRRVLDPEVTNKISLGKNITISPSSLNAFETLWRKTEAERSRHLAPIKPKKFLAFWMALEEQMDPDLFIEPLRAHSCSSPDICIGLNRRNQCVCYKA